MGIKIIIPLVLISLVPSAYSDELDHLLRNRIEFHNIRPVKMVEQNPNRDQVELGKLLFADKNLSGNRRISCQTCHNPETGTSDNFPMSQSEDGTGILRRNAPGLFNVGQTSRAFMFLDGRVHLDPKTKLFKTPEEALNGVNPEAKEIASVLTSALSAQALFPLVTDNEMMGKKGENEIADAENRLAAWDRIIERIKKESLPNKSTQSYAELFAKAYPQTELDKINIGHVGEAIAAFEREEFQSNGSPFQRYLLGDNRAMTLAQKRGFAVFLGRGQCITCHTGGELGKGDLFASVATPQWGVAPVVLDKGRAEVTRDITRNFFFRVPSLTNLKLTAPYMHNGVYQNIRQVIEHYNYLSATLNNFKVTPARQDKFPVSVEVANHPLVLDDIWLSSQSGVNPKIRNRLRLTDREKDYLETFLTEALTDPKWEK